MTGSFCDLAGRIIERTFNQIACIERNLADRRESESRFQLVGTSSPIRSFSTYAKIYITILCACIYSLITWLARRRFVAVVSLHAQDGTEITTLTWDSYTVANTLWR